MALLLALAFSTSTSACPYSIRESGFVAPAVPAPMRLTLRLGEQTPHRTEIEKSFRDATSTFLSGLDASIDVQSTPGADCVLTLEAEDRDPLALPNVQSTPESVKAAVRTVGDSPLRKEVRANLVAGWCVLVYVTAKREPVQQGIADRIREAAEQVVGDETELGKKIERGPHFIEVAGDDSAEAVALWSLGLWPASDQPRLAILIGRGERRGPVLAGAELKPEKVLELVRMLGRSCSCTTDAAWARGPRLPMKMDDGFDATVKRELGFDPDDPEAVEEIRRAWERTGKIAPGDPGLAYREIDLDEPTGEVKSPPEKTSVANEPARPANGPLLLILFGAAVAATAATAIHWFRRQT
jgi:hypothetical protein